MRFRKRLQRGRTALNFSKSGVSATFRIFRGLSFNVGKRGVYVNSGIPKTGLYFRKKILSNRSTKTRKAKRQNEKIIITIKEKKPWWKFW